MKRLVLGVMLCGMLVNFTGCGTETSTTDCYQLNEEIELENIEVENVEVENIEVENIE